MFTPKKDQVKIIIKIPKQQNSYCVTEVESHVTTPEQWEARQEVNSIFIDVIKTSHQLRHGGKQQH